MMQLIVDEGVAALTDGSLESREDSELNCFQVSLDQEGQKEAAHAVERTFISVLLAHERSAKRCRSQKENPCVRKTIFLANFESARAEGREADASND
jgi:hypothetical protein